MGQSIIPIFIPVAFIVMWILLTTLLAWLSGWYKVMHRYPDRAEKNDFNINGTWGQLGVVSFNRCLNLSCCQSGLRVGIIRIFGPFSKPFFVPWGEIRIHRDTFFGFKIAVLEVGRPQVARLTISANTANRLAQASRPHWPELETPEPAQWPRRLEPILTALETFLKWLTLSIGLLLTFTILRQFILSRLEGNPVSPIAIGAASLLSAAMIALDFKNRKR